MENKKLIEDLNRYISITDEFNDNDLDELMVGQSGDVMRVFVSILEKYESRKKD